MTKPRRKRGHDDGEGGLPAGLAAPARRALRAAGYTRLGQLSKAKGAELMQLHGMGPDAMKKIRTALRAAGLRLPRQEL